MTIVKGPSNRRDPFPRRQRQHESFGQGLGQIGRTRTGDDEATPKYETNDNPNTALESN